MKLQVVNITPEMAERYLQINGKNRRKSNDHIARLARKMSQGRWIVNGQTISFDIDGRLIDGQHRLEAIVKSGQTVEHAIAFDVSDPDAFKSYDGDALKRGAGQVAQMMGAKDSSALTSFSRLVLAYEKAKDADEFGRSFGRATSANNEELAEYAVGLQSQYTEARDMIGANFARMTKNPSICYALVHLFNRVDPVYTASFCRKLSSGIFPHADDPCLKLRDRVMAGSTLTGVKERRTFAAVMIKAFSLHCAGKGARNLKWRIEGNNPESFPVINKELGK